MATDFTSYLGVKFKFDSAEARADIVKLLNDLDYFEKKLKGNFDTKAITDWNNKIDTAKQGLNEFGIQVDTVTQQSYQNFRAIGQMDRITREFASGGLTSGLNGLTMFGNSLTRLAVQEGGFKNALGGLVGAFTGPAGIVLAISAVIGFFEEYSKSIKKAEDENKKFIDSLNEINKAAYKIAGGAQAKLATGNVLIGVISDTSKDIETLILTAREEGITIIIAEPQYSRKTADMISNAINGSVVMVDPLVPVMPQELQRLAHVLSGNDPK